MDGHALGKDFYDHLSEAAVESVAYENWLNSNPALKQFAEDHVFFRGLMTSIGRAWRTRATWKKVFRAVRTASFSMLDIGSDLVSVFIYRQKGEWELDINSYIIIKLNFSTSAR